MKRILTLPLITAFVAAPIQTATAATLVSNSAQDPSTMSEEEKSALAKTYYVEAESAFKAGDYLTAVTKYEEAYFLVPGKHGFAYKVGTAAWKLGDCVKADEYFRHYVTYETRESKADKIEEAKKVLGEIALSGCANVEEENPIAAETTATAAADEEDDAPDLSSQREQRAASSDEEGDFESDKESKPGSAMIGAGIGLSVLGAAGLGVGIAFMIKGSSAANSLLDASSNGTTSGFPEGDFSDDEIFNTHNELQFDSVMGAVGLGVGVAAAGAGAALIVLGIQKNKRPAGQSDDEEPAKEKKPAKEEKSIWGSRSLSPFWMRNGGGAVASFKF